MNPQSVKRPAAHLTVIVPPELVSGFRLAGADVEESSSADTARAMIEGLLDDGAPGIVGVYAPFHAELTAGLVDRCERSTDPIVIPLPTGLGGADGVGHRARIAALIERAIGYHITFTGEER